MARDLKALRIDREKKNSKTRRPLGLMLASVLLGLAGLSFGLYSLFWDKAPAADSITRAATEDPQTPVVSPEPADRRVLVASGYVVAHHKIQLGSKVMGKVAWIGVDKGDRVRQGQLLVKLEDREYRARVDESRAALSLAENRMAELVAGYRPEEVERGRAEVARARAEMENSRLELQRLRPLLEAGVVSQKQLDDTRTRYEMAEAAYRAAQRSLDLLEQGTRAEQIAQARAEVERARANLEYHQALLEATELRAPISGTVLERIAEVGEMVTTSFAGDMGAKSAVVILADLNDLQVELDISQADFKRITPDLACQMSPEAFPERTYPCRIDEISPEANRQKATIQVKVKILNPDPFLRPEMNAQVTFFRPGGDSPDNQERKLR